MSQASSAGNPHITFRVDESQKRHVKMRAAQRGYDTVTDYLTDLIDDDLEDADLPPLEVVDE